MNDITGLCNPVIILSNRLIIQDLHSHYILLLHRLLYQPI